VIADAPLDVLPPYARAGAILPKIPDDLMTLVPPEESGNNPRETKRMERRLHLRPPKKNNTLREASQSALAERADSTPQRRQSRRDVTTCSPARQCRVGLGL